MTYIPRQHWNSLGFEARREEFPGLPRWVYHQRLSDLTEFSFCGNRYYPGDNTGLVEDSTAAKLIWDPFVPPAVDNSWHKLAGQLGSGHPTQKIRKPQVPEGYVDEPHMFSSESTEAALRKLRLTPAFHLAQHDPELTLDDPVNHPTHYTGFSNGAEVIDIIEHLEYNRGAAVKYLARAGKKAPDKELEDLEKALWYVQRSIELHNKRLEAE